VPCIRRPVKKRGEQKQDWQAIVLAKQAMAEFSPLIVEEQEIAGGRDDDYRSPHGARNPQEAAEIQQNGKHDQTPSDGANPHADPKKETDPTCRVRLQVKPAGFVGPEKPRVEDPCADANDRKNSHGFPKAENLQNPLDPLTQSFRALRQQRVRDPMRRPPAKDFGIRPQRQIRHARPLQRNCQYKK
jgi:hypothetical protein